MTHDHEGNRGHFKIPLRKTVCPYALMYVKGLTNVYVYVRCAYLCTSVKPAVFVYIREPFSFRPTFCEDFRFDGRLWSYVRTRMCTKTSVHKNLLTYTRILWQEMVLALTDVHEKANVHKIFGLGGGVSIGLGPRKPQKTLLCVFGVLYDLMDVRHRYTQIRTLHK